MTDIRSLGDIPERVMALRARHARRDQKLFQLQAIRRGEFSDIAPGLFSEDFPEPIVANTIDEAAKSYAATLGQLPAINCAPSGTSDAAKRRADKRTKIANFYVAASNLPVSILTGADNLGTFGMIVFCVYPDFEDGIPRINVESPIGTYPVWNRKGETVEVARVYRRDWFSILADYPELRTMRRKFQGALGLDGTVEVVKHVTADRVVCYLPGMRNAVLEDVPNPLGQCYYEVAKLPWLDDVTVKGNYDDVVWVQLARHALQMDLMAGIDQAVNAPLIVTPDVGDVPEGPNAVIHAQGGVQSVGRARLDMPPQAFSAVEQLRQEMHGSANPEALSGSVDASVVTGRGIQQLMAGYSAQVAVGQTVIKAALQRILSKAMRLDEIVFGDGEKTARGRAMGTSYEIQYRPKRDINGEYSCDVEYGFAAGLDANRSLILLLQLQGAGAISRDTMMRNSPIPIDVSEESQQIDIELLRQSAVQAIGGYVASIPQLAANGMDATGPVLAIAKTIDARRAGRSIEDAIREVFAPEPPPEQTQAAPGEAPPAAPGDPLAALLGGGGPQGGQPQVDASTGRPDLSQLFAGIGARGEPRLTAGVSRFHGLAGA